MKVAIYNHGIAFDGSTPLKQPLGGSESSIVYMARALTSCGHDVMVYCNKPSPSGRGQGEGLVPAPSPAASPRPLPGGEASLDSMEKEHIIKILKETGGNKKKAAEILGIERRTLYNKAKRLGIDFSSI